MNKEQPIIIIIINSRTFLGGRGATCDREYVGKRDHGS